MESAVAQICREGGARVSTNVMLRDLDISPPQNSDGPFGGCGGGALFGGCQLALHATLVSPLHGDGTHRRGADFTDGAALCAARKDKVRTYPELCRGNGRALLVVLVGEVGGRWSDETKSFLWCLASSKAAAVTGRLSGSARAAWYRRWTCMLACSAAKGFASSLVGVRGHQELVTRCHLSKRCWQRPGTSCSLALVARSFDGVAVVFSLMSRKK